VTAVDMQCDLIHEAGNRHRRSLLSLVRNAQRVAQTRATLSAFYCLLYFAEVASAGSEKLAPE